MISWKMAAAWVVALVLTTVLTWQIVGLADSHVGDTPVAVAPAPTSTSLTTGSTTPSTTSTSVPAATTTTSVGGPSSTTASSGATSSSSSTTPTTTADLEWSVRTINSPGGTVVIRHRPGEVELQAATPAAGFAVEIDDSGPTRVRVEFESEDTDIRVEAEWDDGELEVSIDD